MALAVGEEWEKLPEPGDGNNKEDEKNEGALEPGKENNDKKRKVNNKEN